MQNIGVDTKISVKKSLAKEGFSYTLIKNTAIFKSFFKSMPNMKGILSGSLAICYSNIDTSEGINFIKLKKVFSVLKKERNMFFLGAFYEGYLVNQLFELKVGTLKDIQSVNLETLSLTQSVSTNIIRTTSNSKNQLSFILSNKAK